MDARGLGNPILFPESLQSVGGDLVERLLWIWREVRAPLIAPLMRVIVFVCLLTNVLLFLERVYMGIVVTFVKIFRRTPERKYKWKPLVTDDIELGNSAYPKVLVQIPMFNEREVYKISIGACCGLSWPTDNLIIQVLDDSTDPSVKELVSAECQRWASKGINIKYEIREKRTGYKAGALKEGMKRSYVRDCDYVVIFDADFRPEPDFLHRTIPFLIHNPELALVQTRWKFVNADECLLTRIQEMSLDYHFTVEQEVGSSTHAFFGFNGTAGVWRISAINEAGGWKERTTVEDMDLAVRASLKGWKFVYIGAVSVRNELPSTFKAFRFQQHRWSCGPANLFRKMFMEIIRCKKVTAKKKFYVIYNFFIIRKIIAHVVTFIFYCIVIPASVMVPEVEIPNWGAVYIPVIVTLLNSVGTPRSFHLVFFWILFENVMSMHRTKATVIGLLEAGRVNEWVVTEKLGDTLKAKATPNTNSNSNSKHLNASSKQTVVVKKPRSKFLERLNCLELMVAIYIFFCATYDFAFGKNNFFIYLYVQSTAFLVVGLGYVGTFVPS